MAVPLELATGVFLHILGAAVWVGGMITLVVFNRALARELTPEARRDLVREVGRRAAPWLFGGFLLAAASGWWLLEARGFAWTQPLVLWKTAFAVLSVGAVGVHIALGRRGGAHPAAAAVLGSLSALTGIVLLVLGAIMRWL